MFRRLKVIYRIFKSDGIIATIRWLVVTLYRRIIPQKQVIWCTDLTKMDSEDFTLPANMKIERFSSVGEIDTQDLNALIDHQSELMGSATSILINERLNKGAILWLIKVNEQIAGYWWTIANNHVTPTYMPYIETDVHAIGIEIFKDFKGKNLLRTFRYYIQSTLKNEGFGRYYSETYISNKHAIKAFLRAGERKIGVATQFSFFGKKVIIWHDMSSKVEFK